MPTADALDTIDRARRSAMTSPYRVVETAQGFNVEEPTSGLSRWLLVAWFAKRADLEAFLTAMLVPPRDHV